MRVILIVLALSQLLLIPSLVLCCSCMTPPPPLESLDRSDYVFTAEVIDSVVPGLRPFIIRGDTTMGRSSADLVRWKVAVICVWKGSIQDTIDVYSARGESSCGFPFKLGEPYLIYGLIMEKPIKYEEYHYETVCPPNTEFPIIVVGLCSRTKILEKATEDINELSVPICRE